MARRSDNCSTRGACLSDRAEPLHILNWDDGGPASAAWFGVEIRYRQPVRIAEGERARLELPLLDPAKLTKP